MPQCITCLYAVMHDQPKGKGVCFHEAASTDRKLDVLERRSCKWWKLGAMHQVRSRSARRMQFDDSGNVRLE